MNIFKTIRIVFVLIIAIQPNLTAQSTSKIIAFYTAKNDPAHISFVHEANRWFAQKAMENHFIYDSTSQWSNLNDDFLSQYQLVVFLDTRPEQQDQRLAFQRYMEQGGAWLGFHFAAFALTPSDFPQNWDWYHNIFLGAGQYKGNTWRPTSAILGVEDHNHAVTQGLPELFSSSPNEWYSWENDLRINPDIRILISIDSSSYPLGTGPKAHEIWHSGYYPVVWTNKKYKMVYMNMGHNDIDYEDNSNKKLSFSFGNVYQDQLILNAINWLFAQ